MAQNKIGSGPTTDTRSTSNTVRYAGDSFRIGYDLGVGTGSKRVQTDLTGYTLVAKAIRMTVTDDNLATAAPAQGAATVDLVVTEVDLANGEFHVYIPDSILVDVGYAVTPSVGFPHYVGYAVSYEEPSGATSETRVIEADVFAFGYNPLYTQ